MQEHPTLAEIKQDIDDVIAWRRDIHMHPEKGFDLPRTSKLVADALVSFGLTVKTGFVPSAVLGILKTGKPGKTVAVRADMDALGMQDMKDVPYRSQNDGICHACGHDSHTSIVLGVARYLARHRDELKGTIKFIFQPAEEGPPPGGAKLIMESGVLDDVDVIIGAHTQPRYNSGTVICRHNEMYGSGDFFEIKIKGCGCHAASPNLGKDVIVTAAQIIEAFQNVRSREISPLRSGVVSVTSINSGMLSTKNVLPDELTMGGTFRTHNDEIRQMIGARLKEIAEGICAINHCECEWTLQPVYPPFSNDNEVVDEIWDAATEVLGSDNVVEMPVPFMGSEDFAYYTKRLKAGFFLFGVRNDEKACNYYYHNPNFNVDEDALAPTIAVMVESVKRLMK